jgi:hypothetical protein
MANVAQAFWAMFSTGVRIGADPRISVNFARVALTTVRPFDPGKPTISGVGNTVNIRWAEPQGGGVPTSYTVLARLTPEGPIIASLPVGNVLTTSVMAPNGSYHVTVRASNAGGNGDESAGTTITVPLAPGSAPGAPSSLSAVVTGTTVQFRWSAPTTGGAPTGYLLRAFVPFGPVVGEVPITGPVTELTVTGAPQRRYSVLLYAINSSGDGPSSNAADFVVMGPGPAAPALNPAFPFQGAFSLAWHDFPEAGSRPDYFEIIASLSPSGPVLASFMQPWTPAPCCLHYRYFAQVPPGTYFVRVRAVNSVGTAISNEQRIAVP